MPAEERPKRRSLVTVVTVYCTLCAAVFIILKASSERMLAEGGIRLPYISPVVSSFIGVPFYWISRAVAEWFSGMRYDERSGRWRWLRVTLIRLPLFMFPILPLLAFVVTLILVLSGV
jgi:hypothetical protein